jgi:hypothetical protein
LIQLKDNSFFVLTENAGRTDAGAPYEMKYKDSYGNVCVRSVDWPDIISKFFQSSNIIDTHNQIRQDLLHLENKVADEECIFLAHNNTSRDTCNRYFSLGQSSKVINYSMKEKDDGKKISIQRFAGMLSVQLIKNAKRLGAENDEAFLPEHDDAPLACITLPSLSVSDLSTPDVGSKSDKNAVCAITDNNGRTHYLVKYDITKDPSGRSRTKKRKCKKCNEEGEQRDVSFYCITCGDSFSFCNNLSGRDCFKHHVESIKRTTRHSN